MRDLLRKKSLSLVRKKTIPFDIYYNCLLSEKILIENKSSKNSMKLLHYIRSTMLAVIVHILSISGSGSGMLYILKRENNEIAQKEYSTAEKQAAL